MDPRCAILEDTNHQPRQDVPITTPGVRRGLWGPGGVRTHAAARPAGWAREIPDRAASWPTPVNHQKALHPHPGHHQHQRLAPQRHSDYCSLQ